MISLNPDKVPKPPEIDWSGSSPVSWENGELRVPIIAGRRFICKNTCPACVLGCDEYPPPERAS